MVDMMKTLFYYLYEIFNIPSILSLIYAIILSFGREMVMIWLLLQFDIRICFGFETQLCPNFIYGWTLNIKQLIFTKTPNPIKK